MSIRDRRGEVLCDWCIGLAEGAVDERRVICLLMWVSARVRAPAMEVVGEAVRVSGEVAARRRERDASRVSWMIRKGLYLFASSEEKLSVLSAVGSLPLTISVSESWLEL